MSAISSPQAAGGDQSRGDQAFARDARRLPLAPDRLLAPVTEGAFNDAHAADERRELAGLERAGVVGPRQAAVQGEVLLDQAGAQGRGGQRDLDAGRMVREADRPAEGGGERRHGPQVGLPGGGRIAADAVEQDEGRVPRLLDRADGVADLPKVGHPRREDDRAAFAGDVREQREVGDLAGGDLKGGDAEALK